MKTSSARTAWRKSCWKSSPCGEALRHLGEKERLVIQLRYYHSLTQQRVAELIGVSQVQVSRIEKKALERLRTFF